MQKHIKTIWDNSYKDLHTKGIDYVCVRRSLVETIKYYFFADDLVAQQGIVSPHDHRYAFTTMVMEGEMENVFYKINRQYGKSFHRWYWDTPLNGGAGFSSAGISKLNISSYATYCAGQIYAMNVHEIHTIKIKQRGTVLRLVQYEDQIPINEPSITYTETKHKPSIDGVYNKFYVEELYDRLRQINSYGLDFVEV